MNFQPTSNKKIHESESEIFRTRLLARLCVALACLTQSLARVATIFNVSNMSGLSQKLLICSLPFAPLVTLTVAIEYFLFKKFRSKTLKYSIVGDLTILSLFIGEWTLGVLSFLLSTEKSDPAMFSVTALFGFIGFAWRALLVTLIVQKWQLKIIAPIIASLLTTGFAIHYDSEHYYFYIIRTIAQVFNIVLILYCEDKIKWRMIWTNLQQEKWMQVNNFILNNIPENIMILDLTGQTQFISDYCKSFMEKCNLLYANSKDFFNKIRDLQLQHDDTDPSSHSTNFALQIDRLTTGNELITETNETNPALLKIDTLADLISNFKNIVKERNLKERQFVIYNGKLQIENQAEKSIEIKISFVQHYKSEYLILILRDTTQRDLLITLEKTNKYKDQLLASVSHELRAPLNGNINLVESAISSPKIPENIKETLLVPALRSSKFLLHLINDILDMSQIKEKKLRLIFQSGDLKETLMSTAQLIELQAKKKGIELKLELDPNLPENFCTDHVRLGQIVLNLLSNAIKFTKQGTVKLSVTCTHPSRCVKITVRDSGIGMSQENIPKLFSNYTHIEFEERQAINPTGVGLGLNIANSLVQLLGPAGNQSIKVASTPNQGSTFSFIIEDKKKASIHIEEREEENNSDSDHSYQVAEELPGKIKPISFVKLPTFESSKSVMTERSESQYLLKSCACSKILVVDDNLFNIMAFEAILNSLEIKCDSVYSGSSALEKLLSREKTRCGKDCQQYSVVFMDQEMPEISGADTAREIRKLQKEKKLPQNLRIIGCTAHKSKEEVERFLEAGLDGCIHKPISVSMIKDIL